MAEVDLPVPHLSPVGQTARGDRWWLPWLLAFPGFAAFIVYSTWAALQAEHCWLAEAGVHDLSPFESPLIFDPVGASTGYACVRPRAVPEQPPHAPGLGPPLPGRLCGLRCADVLDWRDHEPQVDLNKTHRGGQEGAEPEEPVSDWFDARPGTGLSRLATTHAPPSPLPPSVPLR